MKRAGDLLSAFFNEHFDPVSLENGRMTAGLFSSWVSAARAANIGAAADHSRIRELEHKVLLIEADHPGWVQLLQTKQRQLLQYVQVKFPELDIQGISFCLSSEPISRAFAESAAGSAEDSAPVPGKEAIQPEAETPSPLQSGLPVSNEALYEPIKKFKKIIQERNKKIQE